MRIAIAVVLALFLCTAPAWAAAGSMLGERDPDWQYVLEFTFFHGGQQVSHFGMLLMDGTVSTCLEGWQSPAAMAVHRDLYAVGCEAAVLINARQPWTVRDYLGEQLRNPVLKRACEAASHFTFGNLEIDIYRPDADWAEIKVRRISMNNPHGICLSEYHEDLDPEIMGMIEYCGTLGVSLPSS